MGILARTCTCGDIKAFEYGDRRKMQDLKVKLEGKDEDRTRPFSEREN